MSARNLPPVWSKIAKHAVFPETTHDERARYNFLANLNKHLAHVSQGNKIAFDKRVEPKFEKEHGRKMKDTVELKKAMEQDPHYQVWSSLRRSTMEMRQQAGRSIVLRQADYLKEKAKKLNEGKASLVLDANCEVPNYLLACDNHIMPGSYHTELIEGDVTPAANYDTGLFVTTAGLLGTYSDGGGKATGCAGGGGALARAVMGVTDRDGQHQLGEKNLSRFQTQAYFGYRLRYGPQRASDSQSLSRCRSHWNRYGRTYVALCTCSCHGFGLH